VAKITYTNRHASLTIAKPGVSQILSEKKPVQNLYEEWQGNAMQLLPIA